ncbi:hypothetical protein HBI38_212450 [Parastagonospora nodorum]|nr:hypothetical protein HBH92_219730 [Parastagonospora nodorum]KAH4408375.1 hypothetical protein HBH93_227320 [Parastagonospora nodorum]KAH4435164.1 hypothetical protein HBH91_204150 [Parastagonospora nodorum]KAH4486490.1 hypothetical protein HBH89_206660 [Parastagonospora nodorum]KAH4525886.1 hypothetical protein HBH85_221270 [Parastagonospora nodorum]
MSTPESLEDILRRRATSQATNTAPGMMGMEDVIEIAPYEPWCALVQESRNMELAMGNSNTEATEATNARIRNKHRSILEQLLQGKDIMEKLKEETAQSVKELQHEIDVAARGVKDREEALARYATGWRSTVQKLRRSSKPEVLRMEVDSHKTVIRSLERIQRLVRDNEAARQPAMERELAENLKAVEKYEDYIQLRGLTPGGMTSVQLR